jgi:hypothetical protein
MESLRGSTDTGELLRAAVKRADHIRSELVQLRVCHLTALLQGGVDRCWPAILAKSRL